VSRPQVCRRALLGGAAAVPLVAACGGTSAPEAPKPGETVARTADVPVGGGVITGAVVVTQPEKGTFKAFSSTCTHQHCTVSSVDDGIIHCACHGSEFSITDGSVVHGPATEPLPAEQVEVEGDSIVLA
jgi:Rieske Fe-S protein